MTNLAGPMLVATLWQSAIFAFLVVLCLRFVPRTTAALRFVLWTAALLLVCLLPLTSLLQTAPIVPVHRAILHADPRWSLALAALWFTLSFVRATDLLRHALRLRSLSRDATPVPVRPDLDNLLRTHRRAQVCTSTHLDRPGVIGFFTARILIPAWLFEQLTEPELEQIVLHELEHLRRRDDWLNLLQKVALVVFPLNPALYWIERRLCLERELACDEGVVRRTRAPQFYATCMARLAEHGMDHRAAALALGFLERQSQLARRVASILQTPQTISKRQRLAVTGTVAALLLGTFAELARVPQLVSFAASPSIMTSQATATSSVSTMWAVSTAPTVLYTDAAAARLASTAFQPPRPVARKKAKVHRVHLQAPAQRAFVDKIVPFEEAGHDLTPATPTALPMVPTMVRYTLVPVEGGWLLVQL